MMTYVVVHHEDYETSAPVAAFNTLTNALDFAKEKADAYAIERTQKLRFNHEATVTRYHQQIAEHGPDHIPDELEVRTSMPGEPDPWLEKTLAERLREIERRGPGVCGVTPLDDRAGYRAGYEAWEVTALESGD